MVSGGGGALKGKTRHLRREPYSLHTQRSMLLRETRGRSALHCSGVGAGACGAGGIAYPLQYLRAEQSPYQ